MGEFAALITALTGLGAALAGLGKWLKDEFVKANDEQQKIIQSRFDDIEKSNAFLGNQVGQVQQIMAGLCEQTEKRDRSLMQLIVEAKGRLASIEARVAALEKHERER